MCGGPKLLHLPVRAAKHFPNSAETQGQVSSIAGTVDNDEPAARGEIRTLKHLFLRQAAIPIRTRWHPGPQGGFEPPRLLAARGESLALSRKREGDVQGERLLL
jgi:hypothetical protein